MGQLDEEGARASVDVSVDGSGSPVLALSGEIDISNVASIETEVETVLARSPERLVFDLSQLDFIDSSGIAMLLRAGERSARVEIRKPSSTVQRVIRATGLDDVLHVQP